MKVHFHPLCERSLRKPCLPLDDLLFPSSAAGLGLEPRYPGPKPGVLPLDDPAALEINVMAQ